MEASSTSRRPCPWSASGRKIAMKLDAFGQLVASAHDWVAPSVMGNASATTQAALVRARVWPAAAALMNLSTEYPAAMAANHTPSPTYSFREAIPCSRAWFSGPRTAAAASTASIHVRAHPSRPAQLRKTPQTARTATRPTQDQEWASTASRELPVG